MAHDWAIADDRAGHAGDFNHSVPANASRHRLIRKLRDALGASVCQALDDTSVVEIMVNPDGRLFVERLGQGMEMPAALEPGAAEIIIGSVAHALQTEVDTVRPIISGELPIGGHRFEGLLPPLWRRQASQSGAGLRG